MAAEAPTRETPCRDETRIDLAKVRAGLTGLAAGLLLAACLVLTAGLRDRERRSRRSPAVTPRAVTTARPPQTRAAEQGQGKRSVMSRHAMTSKRSVAS